MTTTPQPFRSLVAMLRHRAATQADDRAYTFLVDGEVEGPTLGYAELDARARAIAALLAAHGVAPGERALLPYPPGLDFVAAFFGCLYAGVVAVPCYPPHPAQLARALPRLLAITTDAAPSVVLCSAAALPMAAALAPHVPALARLPWLATDAALPDPASWRPPRVDGDTLAFLQYTSGSTAAPRGVMVSHGNLLHNLAYADHVEENDAASVSVSWLPVIHDMGLIEGVLEPAFAGYPAYLMAPAAFLQRPVRWLQAVSRYGATNSGGPNFAYDLCVRKIAPAAREALDLRRWRVAYNGAEPIRRDTLVAFHEAFRPCGFRWRTFYPVYGLAESTLVVSSGRRAYEPVVREVDAGALGEGRIEPASAASRRAAGIVSSGPASFGTRAVIVDPETRRPCADGRVGEIWLASPSVARGYWRRPEETAHTFGATLADGDGPFLRTGDLGALCDGELFVTGRLKDLLIVRGLKHYPQDLELTAEASHPAIRAGCCAAFAVAAADAEQVVLAAEVDPRRWTDGDADAVMAGVQQAIVECHGVQVHAVVLLGLGAIPKTTSGKIRRQACRDAYVAGTLHEVARSTRAAA